jgi:tetratricopeptide (TPR) repeat protein
MAEKNNEESTSTGFSLKSLDSFYNKNKKVIIIAAVAVVVVVGGIFYYNNQIKAPKEKAATAAMFKAEFYFQLDSFNLALNGRAEANGMEGFMGFNEIIDQYGGTKAGNLSRYYAGISNLHLGKYEEAIDHLKKFSTNDVILGSIALGCIGDAYRELGNSEDAVKYYEKAARRNSNSFTTPIYLKKAALTYEEDLKDYDKALATYIKIEKEYGNTQEGRDITKYIARLKTMTGK